METQKLNAEIKTMLEDESFDFYNMVVEHGMHTKYIDSFCREWLKTRAFPEMSNDVLNLYDSMKKRLHELAHDRLSVTKECPNCDNQPLKAERDSRGREHMVCRKCGYQEQVHKY